MDEQAQEIMADLADYYANPEEYSFQDLEDIFQDRDPLEFLQDLTNTRKGAGPQNHHNVKQLRKINIFPQNA